MLSVALVLAGGLAANGLAVEDSVSATRPLSVDSQRVAVELTLSPCPTCPAVPAETVLAALRAKGFTDVQKLPYAGSTTAPVYSVAVPNRDAATLASIRDIGGVRAVRNLYQMPDQSLPVVPTDRVVLKARAGVSDEQIVDLLAREKCEFVTRMGIGVKMYVGRVRNATGNEAGSVAARIRASGLAEFAEVDFHTPRKLHAVAINDPLFSSQWHLQNRGDLPGAVVGADVKAVDAWEITMGATALVAVFDDAIDWRHPDLVDNIVARYDFAEADDDPSPTPPYRFTYDLGGGLFCDAFACDRYWGWGCGCWGFDDCLFSSDSYAHGTCTTGLVGARANNVDLNGRYVGLCGVAPEAGLIPMRNPIIVSDAVVAQAFYWADQNGAQVISNSWGFTGPGSLVAEVIQSAVADLAVNGRGGLGVLIMFAAGNDNLPAAQAGSYSVIPGSMGIGASLRNDLRACYSNFGPELSVFAPGGGGSPFGTTAGAEEVCFKADIATTDVTDITDPTVVNPFCQGAVSSLKGYNPPPPPELRIYAFDPDFEDQYYHNGFNGTSSACPIAAGCAALVFSVNSNLTAWQVRGILEHTADKVQVEGGGYNPVTGLSNIFAHGRVNAARAVQAAQDGRVWPRPPENFVSQFVGNRVNLYWTNAEADAVGALVVRSIGPLTFAPVDGASYSVGQVVAPNTVVVANDLIEQYTDSNAPNGELNYGVFIRNAIDYYSWGRLATWQSQAARNAPKASANASPSAGNAPLPVLFSGGADDPQGRRITSYAWDFGDGATATGPSVRHTYDTPGQYLAKLTVQNSAGLTGLATVFVTVYPSGTVVTAGAEAAGPGSTQQTQQNVPDTNVTALPVLAPCGAGAATAMAMAGLMLAGVRIVRSRRER